MKEEFAIEQVFVLKWLRWLINRPIKRHWYEVRFTYKNRGNDKKIFEYTNQIGLKHQSDILNSRKIRKNQTPLHKVEWAKGILVNGNFCVETIAYLGYFKEQRN